ncbi:MAG: antibiotic biosynthesis monooxygenase family protein [Myxococcota bacterium]
MTPLLVTAEFVFTEEGEAEFRPHLDRTLAEVREIDGCLQALVWTRPGRRYQFMTLWTDGESVARWVENDFHRKVLMPGFRKWCSEGCFGEYRLETDHKRARRCPDCGRWTQTLPGWNESEPSVCAKCGAALPVP